MFCSWLPPQTIGWLQRAGGEYPEPTVSARLRLQKQSKWARFTGNELRELLFSTSQFSSPKLENIDKSCKLVTAAAKLI